MPTIHAREMPIYRQLAEAPTAVEYGVGPAWIGGVIYWSDGETWISGTELYANDYQFSQNLSDNVNTDAGSHTKYPSVNAVVQYIAGIVNTLSASIATKLDAASPATLTNKRITSRVLSITSSATPSINIDQYDDLEITAQAVNILSITVTGTPTKNQLLLVSITGTASQSITWGPQFESSLVALPTMTNGTSRMDVICMNNQVSSKWRCMGVV